MKNMSGGDKDGTTLLGTTEDQLQPTKEQILEHEKRCWKNRSRKNWLYVGVKNASQKS